MNAQSHLTPPRCTIGAHIGPIVGTERYDRHPEAHWLGFGECAVCGSTVHRDHVVSTPAFQEAA